jgi:hypothetical protein
MDCHSASVKKPSPRRLDSSSLYPPTSPFAYGTAEPEPRSRWRAIITHRTEHGTTTIERLLEELVDLDRVVEQGPHWDTIVKMEVFRFDPLYDNLTIEGAQKI